MNSVPSGLLLVNKPLGPTSHDIVYRLRRLLGIKSVGHAGTLDPLAEGLMVMLVGKATKVSQWIMNSDKEYQGTLVLGRESTTGDAEGETLKEFDKKEASHQELTTVFSGLLGTQTLPVPKFSAVKKDGKVLYKMARAGEEIDVPLKDMTFYSADLNSIEGSEVNFTLACSKGSYVRSWVVAVGSRVESGAFLKSLCRTKCGAFELDRAFDLKKLDGDDVDPLSLRNEIFSSRAFVPLSEALPDAELIRMSSLEKKLLCNGQIPRTLMSRTHGLCREAHSSGKEYLLRAVGPTEDLVGLLSIDQKGKLSIRRVFN